VLWKTVIVPLKPALMTEIRGVSLADFGAAGCCWAIAETVKRLESKAHPII